MILAPIRMINSNEFKMRLYNTGKCIEKVNQIKNLNEESISSLKKIVEVFKTKYSDKLKKFYGKENNYDINFIKNFCDAFCSGYNERRNMKFYASGFDEKDLKEFCDDFIIKYYKDYTFGDKNHSIAHLESSKLMNEFIHYMDKRIQNDINKNKNSNNDVDKNLGDYSNPKMLMISGHDTTISCYEIFLKEAFGMDDNFYRYPQFASQISFEVVTKEGIEKGQKEEDYVVKYFFDDISLLNVSVPEFKNKVRKQIWDDETILTFCGYNKENKDSSNDKKDSNNNDNNNNKNDTLLKICFIITSSLALIFLITTIALCVKLVKFNRHESRIYNSLLPNNEENS